MVKKCVLWKASDYPTLPDSFRRGCTTAGVRGAGRGGTSIWEWLTALREAGLGSIPGTAAEILDDEVRWVLTKGKLPMSMWIEVVTTAHEVEPRSSSTMMYGHVDTPRHWVGHLRVMREIQDRIGGSPS